MWPEERVLTSTVGNQVKWAKRFEEALHVILIVAIILRCLRERKNHAEVLKFLKKLCMKYSGMFILSISSVKNYKTLLRRL